MQTSENTQKEIILKLVRFMTTVNKSRNMLYDITTKSLEHNQVLRKNIKGPIMRSVNGSTRLIEVRDRTFKIKLGYDLIKVVDKAIREGGLPGVVKTYVYNEIYNLINFGALSFYKVLRTKIPDFEILGSDLLAIANEVRKLKGIMFKECTGTDVHDLVSHNPNAINTAVDYYTVFTLPGDNVELISNPKAHVVDPLIFDDELKITYNHSLNNHVNDINEKYGTSLYIKCLVPKTYVDKHIELKNFLEKGFFVQDDLRNPKGYLNGNSYSVMLDKLMNDKGLFENKEYVSKKDYLDIYPYWIVTKETLDNIAK